MDPSDYPHMNFAGLDNNLVQATLASLSTNTITPIIKEELKLKIQSKRLASGKEELPKTVFKEPEKYEMTPEEKQKRQHKRELNRVAAQKCRQKRKLGHESVKTAQAEQELRNYALRRRVQELESEKRNLVKRLLEQQIVLPKNTTKNDLIKTKDTLTELETDTPYLSFAEKPSTSSGIFHNDYPHRRFSEDAVHPPPPLYPYIPRRHSVLTYQSPNPSPGDHPCVLASNQFGIYDQCHTQYPHSTVGFLESNVALQVHQDMLKNAVQTTCELFDIPDSASEVSGCHLSADDKKDLPFDRYTYDDIPDFLDEDLDFLENKTKRGLPCSSGFRCETPRMEDHTTVHKEEIFDMGKEETNEDFFERFFRPLQVTAIREDEATVPGCNTACVTPVSPSFY